MTGEMRGEWRRFRRMVRPIDRGPGRGPTPPPGVPPGQIVRLEGRGETFVRHHQGPPDAPVVLLLHGWTASADLQWCTLYPALCERYSVIGIDHRGHGRGIRSEEKFTLEDCADDAAAVVRLLAPGRQAVIIGYSMGGPIAPQLWRRQPDVVAALVFEATALEMHETREDRFRWRLLMLAEGILRSRRLRSWLARYLREEAYANPDLEPYTPWMLAEMRRTDPRALYEAGLALRDFDARPFASSIDVPVAVVITTDDHIVRPVKQRALAEATGATVFEIKADHDATMAAAKPFAAVTVEAIEAVSGVERDERSARRLA